MDYECGTCGKVFPAGWRARENHCRATGHEPPDFECERCPRWFRSWQACFQHMSAKNHFALECHICDETWPTEEDRTTHENEDHYYCADCDRNFRNYNNLKMHLQSRIHRGEQMACPFCKRCFTTSTGVAHHLESSACPNAPHINRDTVYQVIRSRDPHGAISKKLLTWQGSDQTRYEATGRSWNGCAYECYFCHREFGKLQSLTQHLNSPAHQQELDHCPNRACRMDFKTLASVINRLESESCGFMRFEAVQGKMGNVLRGDRLLTF
ncbi:hypothetical protein N656DRAFT_731338 [Canariomyces notabilis]|uniref:C2H2-type domain-containing protein n=1 Tax=Canariomyces notabilis TaxID=2074819 RepID=A0AAN6TEE6_9PEZI|nr:hypothetical protein N656DRAFT_731338 [Canariomyces arenarius]